jgi:hypothetical protein
MSASAQVYSVNAVGYVNVNVPKGFSMIANPLKADNNKVSALFAAAPNGTILYKFNNGAYVINTKDFGEFENPADEMLPGDGAFINAPSAFTVTFVGEVMQGDLKNPLPQGFSIKSSQVPQSGDLQKDLGFPAVDGDVIYRYSNTANGYTISTWDFGAWDAVPTPAVGEAFFVNKIAAVDWTRKFSVNQ